MANITLGGNPVKTSGDLPSIGSQIADFKLVAVDLSTKTLKDFLGSHLILNIFHLCIILQRIILTRICETGAKQKKKS